MLVFFFWENNGEYLGTALLPNGVAVDFPSTVAFIAFQSGGTGFSEGQKLYAYTGNFYEPYQGDTYDIALPETVYGGEVYCVPGAGSKKWEYREFDGTENWLLHTYDSGNFFFYLNSGDINSKFVNTGIFSHGICGSVADQAFSKVIIQLPYDNNQILRMTWEENDLEEFKAYLSAQYAAGTPVTLAYQLAAPEPFEVNPNPISALSGVNTVYTDGDSLEVTGRVNPVYKIHSLESRLAAIESDVTTL